MKKTLFILITLFTIGLVASQNSTKPNYLKFNWFIMNNEISKEDKIVWEEELIPIHKFFIKYLGYKAKKLDINIFYFTDLEAFKKYQLENFDRILPTIGFYLPKNGSLYMINRNNASSHAKSTFIHEATHRIFNTEILGNAIILNEGLATLFQTIHKKGNSFYVGENARFEKKLAEAIEENKLYDLKTFFKISNQEWLQNTKVSYAQSNALMYFLLTFNPELLQLIIKDYKQPPNARKGYVNMINKNYSTGMKGFEKDWKKWILTQNKLPIKLDI